MYLNGYKLEELLEKDFQMFLFNYCDFGFCFEFSALAMMTRHGDRTSRLVQGSVLATIDMSNRARTVHAWVEYDSPIDGKKVLDYYSPQSVNSLDDYYSLTKPDIGFVCSYEDFWGNPRTEALYRHLQEPETSHLLDMLTYYRPLAQQYGFDNADIYSQDRSDFGIKMSPFDTISSHSKKHVTVTQGLIDSIMAQRPV